MSRSEMLAGNLMKTPAGSECKFFYGDYFRGRHVEECRLLKAAGEGWSPDLCRSCPMPEILRANACEFLQFRGSVTRPLTSAFQRRVRVSAFCEKANKSVSEPQVGCGQCHPLPPEFVVRE
jgi:hypothetical protein